MLYHRSLIIHHLSKYHPSKALPSCIKNLLARPAFNLKIYGRCSFAVAAPSLWNPLPDDIKSFYININIINIITIVIIIIIFTIITVRNSTK